jgi:hypothetical protein
MAPKNLVKFNKLAAAEMRWRYMPKFPYGDGRPGTRRIMPSFRDKLVHAFVDLWILSGLGPAKEIVSAGAWVPEGTKCGSGRRGPDDKHVLGIAIDLDAIHWPACSLVMHPDHSEPDFYLGVEAHFRCYFHTVLGWSYNAAHKGHVHIDDGRDLLPWQLFSYMHKSFLQAVMKHVWFDDGKPYYSGKIDGKWGTKSRSAWKKLAKRLVVDKDISKDLPSWIRFLQLTAIQGMRVQ